MKTDKKLFYKVPFKGILAAWILFLCSYGQTFAQCPGQTANVVVSTNTLWAISATIDHNTEVTSGATLTLQLATFSFIPNVKITVDYGAHLVIDNAILTNSCTDLWGGIVVIGDTEAAQNGSMSSITIENGSQINYAETGVLMGDPTDSAGGGGLMSMIGSSINNCYMGVVFYAYPDSNTSHIDSSSFTASAPLPGYDSTGMHVGIAINGVYGLLIDGVTITNSIDPSLLSQVSGGNGTGIQEKKASIFLMAYPYARCANGNQELCCPDNYGNRLQGWGVAITNQFYLKGLSQTSNRIEECNFKNNFVDLDDENTKYTIVTHSTFTKEGTWIADNPGNYPKIDPSYFPQFTGSAPMYDIYSNNSQDIDISDNVFYCEAKGNPYVSVIDCSVGGITQSFGVTQISITNSGAASSRIYLNTFGMDVHTDIGSNCNLTNQAYYANWMDGNNLGLQIKCNTYYIRGWAPSGTPGPGCAGSQATLCSGGMTIATTGSITVQPTTLCDWYLNTPSAQLPDQGNATIGAGNDFTNYSLLTNNAAGAGGGNEYNIFSVFSTSFNYYNWANWTDDLTTTIYNKYPAIWINGGSPVSSTYQKTSASHNCPASNCMNFVLAQNYHPGGPPASPLFTPQMSGVKIFPNPTANLLNIQYNFGADNNNDAPASIQLQIVDFSGKTISTTLLSETQGSMTLDTKLLASGIYFYRFTDTNRNKILNSGKFAVSR